MKKLKIRLPRKIKKQMRKNREIMHMMAFLDGNGKRRHMNVVFKFKANTEATITL